MPCICPCHASFLGPEGWGAKREDRGQLDRQGTIGVKDVARQTTCCCNACCPRLTCSFRPLMLICCCCCTRSCSLLCLFSSFMTAPISYLAADASLRYRCRVSLVGRSRLPSASEGALHGMYWCCWVSLLRNACQLIQHDGSPASEGALHSTCRCWWVIFFRNACQLIQHDGSTASEGALHSTCQCWLELWLRNAWQLIRHNNSAAGSA